MTTSSSEIHPIAAQYIQNALRRFFESPAAVQATDCKSAPPECQNSSDPARTYTQHPLSCNGRVSALDLHSRKNEVSSQELKGLSALKERHFISIRGNQSRLTWNAVL